MVNPEPQDAATLGRRRDERAGGSVISKLGALLFLVLLVADLLTRQIGLLAESAREPLPRRATTNFFELQVGGFHAEIEWDDIGKRE